MKIKNISHVFFDLDHTLWDFDKNSTLTFEKIFELNNINVNLDEFIEVYEPINIHYWKLYREEKIDKASLRYGRLKDAFNMLNIKVKSGMIYKLSDDYISYLPTFNHLFDGAIEILDYLHIKYKLHIITNGFKEVQAIKMSSSGLDEFFDIVLCSEDVGVNKPNPKVFELALELANAKNTESVMIGDNYDADIVGAENVGMKTIFFNPTHTIVDSNTKQIYQLSELIEIFGQT